MSCPRSRGEVVDLVERSRLQRCIEHSRVLEIVVEVLKRASAYVKDHDIGRDLRACR